MIIAGRAVLAGEPGAVGVGDDAVLVVEDVLAEVPDRAVVGLGVAVERHLVDAPVQVGDVLRDRASRPAGPFHSMILVSGSRVTSVRNGLPSTCRRACRTERPALTGSSGLVIGSGRRTWARPGRPERRLGATGRRRCPVVLTQAPAPVVAWLAAGAADRRRTLTRAGTRRPPEDGESRSRTPHAAARPAGVVGPRPRRAVLVGLLPDDPEVSSRWTSTWRPSSRRTSTP